MRDWGVQGLDEGRGRGGLRQRLRGVVPCCCSHLSPQAVQVLRRLEPYHTWRNIFNHISENNRRHQEQQWQLPW